MENSKSMRSVFPELCPHCGKEIMVSVRSTTPIIDWVHRPEDLEASKKKILEGVEKIKFKNEEEKKGVLFWINDESTLLGPSEVDIVLSQLEKENEEVK
jgi:hypothetical protein